MLHPHPWTGRNILTLDKVRDYIPSLQSPHRLTLTSYRKVYKVLSVNVHGPDLKTKHLPLYSSKSIYCRNRFTLSFNFFNFITTPCISIVYLITHTNTHTHTHIYIYIYIYIHTYIYNIRSLKFTLKHLKHSYMFRSHDHPQGSYIIIV